jgi:succinate-semialdehyde dehydrogenase / glutarate-semialdehyde dehydrogenase
MPYATTNPATGQTEREFSTMSDDEIDDAIERAHDAYQAWRSRPIQDRARVIGRVAELMLERSEELARLITLEMGKLIAEARGEVGLAASIFSYYADHGAELIADESYDVEDGEATVVTRPIGPLIGVMPWNFPYYQVARFAAPNVVLGNTILLKHASINPQCALAIAELLEEAGAPEGVYTNLFVASEKIERIIDSPKVAGASLTGSEPAGQSVGEIAGRNLKKAVLELGGSDPFIVLDGENLERTIQAAVVVRMANTGQSCVASKRFIVLKEVYDRFVAQLATEFAKQTRRPG